MPLDQQTFDHLKGLWVAAGGAPGRSDVAAAIAFAESSGCQYALAGPVDIRPVQECHWTKTDGENSCGYWQINLRAHARYSAPAIFGELENAKAAVAISDDGRDFRPWSTYKDGAYQPFLQEYGYKSPADGGGSGGGGGGDGHFGSSGDGELAPAGDWNAGWEHFTHELAHTLPTALAQSHHLGARTLRVLHRKSRLG